MSYSVWLVLNGDEQFSNVIFFQNLFILVFLPKSEKKLAMHHDLTSLCETIMVIIISSECPKLCFTWGIT